MTNRVLFISVAVGEGHTRAAEAIRQALAKMYPYIETQLINAFDYANPMLGRLIIGTYLEIIKVTPLIYRYLYQRAETARSMTEFTRLLNRLLAIRLKRLLREFNPRVIVCTHPFACGLMSALKKNPVFNIPVIAVVTDFTIHPFWVYPNIEMYAVAAEELKQALMVRGVPAERIRVTGIPIDPKFDEDLDKEALKKKFNLDPGLSTVLVMGGGLGLGPVEDVVRTLGKLTLPLQMLVVVGRNLKLQKKIASIAQQLTVPLKVFGYVDNIHELMEVSDLIISKPGGLTSSEALAKGLPIVIINPIPGQEEHNTRFLLRGRAAVRVRSAASLAKVIQYLILSPIRTAAMREIARQIGKPEAADTVARLVTEYLFLLRARGR